MNYKRLIGKQFGALRICDVEIDRKTKMPTLKAVCKCGKSGELTNTDLKFETNPDCMCHAFYKLEAPLTNYDKAILSIYKSYKKRAKNNNKGFTLSLRGFKRFVEANCVYCESPPSNTLTYGELTIKYNGIDRINSEDGYVEGNICTACFVCNRAKGNMGHVAFLNHIDKMYKCMESSIKNNKNMMAKLLTIEEDAYVSNKQLKDSFLRSGFNITELENIAKELIMDNL